MEPFIKPKILFLLKGSDADKYDELLPVLEKEGVLDICTIDILYDDLPPQDPVKDYQLIVILLSPAFLGSPLERQLHDLRDSSPPVLPIYWTKLDYSTSFFSNTQFAPGFDTSVEDWPVKVQALRSIAKNIIPHVIGEFKMKAAEIEEKILMEDMYRRLEKKALSAFDRFELASRKLHNGYTRTNLLHKKWFSKKAFDLSWEGYILWSRSYLMGGLMISLALIALGGGLPGSPVLWASLLSLPAVYGCVQFFHRLDGYYSIPYGSRPWTRIKFYAFFFRKNLLLPFIAVWLVFWSLILLWQALAAPLKYANTVMLLEVGVEGGFIAGGLFYLLSSPYVPKALIRKIPAITDPLATFEDGALYLFVPLESASRASKNIFQEMGSRSSRSTFLSSAKIRIGLKGAIRLLIEVALFASFGWWIFKRVDPDRVFFQGLFSVGFGIMYFLENNLVGLYNFLTTGLRKWMIRPKNWTLAVIYFLDATKPIVTIRTTAIVLFVVEFLLYFILHQKVHAPILLVWIVAIFIPIYKRLPCMGLSSLPRGGKPSHA